jgi:hypothetical protein
MIQIGSNWRLYSANLVRWLLVTARMIGLFLGRLLDILDSFQLGYQLFKQSKLLSAILRLSLYVALGTTLIIGDQRCSILLILYMRSSIWNLAHDVDIIRASIAILPRYVAIIHWRYQVYLRSLLNRLV